MSHAVGCKTALILVLYKLTSARTRARTLHSTTHTYCLDVDTYCVVKGGGEMPTPISGRW